MKLKLWFIFGGLFALFVGLLLFVGVLIEEEDNSSSPDAPDYVGLTLSADVLAYQETVRNYAEEFGILEHLWVLLAIMQVESGGIGQDVMQSSESLGLPPNTLATDDSIQQGVKYFSELLYAAQEKGIDDINVVIQSYNFGSGFLDYVANHGKQYSYVLAESSAQERADSVRVRYTNPVAIPVNGGWRYRYGNQFYVQLVSQYLIPSEFDDEVVQMILVEAYQFEGWTYVYGGDSPTTSFDCSGLTQWAFGQAGISLPRTAQQQYDVAQPIASSEAKPGDLVFFHSTYNSGTYVTHLGIYVGNNQMFHAGDPIGFADITQSYWQEHFIGFGRILHQ